MSLTDLVLDLLRDARVRAELASIVRETMRDMPREPATPADDLLDAKGAAALLSMTVAAVRMAAQRGKLPSLRLGRNLRFRRAELLAAARRG